MLPKPNVIVSMEQMLNNAKRAGGSQRPTIRGGNAGGRSGAGATGATGRAHNAAMATDKGDCETMTDGCAPYRPKGLHILTILTTTPSLIKLTFLFLTLTLTTI
jgi:hypothetical protein